LQIDTQRFAIRFELWTDIALIAQGQALDGRQHVVGRVPLINVGGGERGPDYHPAQIDQQVGLQAIVILGLGRTVTVVRFRFQHLATHRARQLAHGDGEAIDDMARSSTRPQVRHESLV
jgi:hypothetical protein